MIISNLSAGEDSVSDEPIVQQGFWSCQRPHHTLGLQMITTGLHSQALLSYQTSKHQGLLDDNERQNLQNLDQIFKWAAYLSVAYYQKPESFCKSNLLKIKPFKN